MKSAAKQTKPFTFTLPLLIQRSMLNLYRQPILLSTRISQGLFFALILAAFYAPIGESQIAVQNIMGNLYELSALCFIGMLNCIAQFPIERNVFYREYRDGGYGAMSFIFTYFIIAFPILCVSAILISLLMCFGVGLCNSSSESYWLVTYVLFSFMFVGECVGVMFCVIFTHIGFSVNIMSMIISMLNILAGFIALDMPIFFEYIGFISPNKWGSIIMSNAVLQGQVFTCDADEVTASGECYFATGEQVLLEYNMNYNPNRHKTKNFYIIVFTAMICLYFVFTLFVFRIKAYLHSH
jgi:hypothetical protein